MECKDKKVTGANKGRCTYNKYHPITRVRYCTLGNNYKECPEKEL